VRDPPRAVVAAVVAAVVVVIAVAVAVATVATVAIDPCFGFDGVCI
jgi:hypothetical protein